MRFIRNLTTGEHPAFRNHLLRLDADDRRLRFGMPMDDEAIRNYADRLDPAQDRLLGCADDQLRIVAAVQLSTRGESVEFAFSVDREWRSRGLAQSLMDRAVLWSRNRGMREALLVCARQNAAMRHVAHKAGMELAIEGSDCYAGMPLVPATPFSLVQEFVAEHGGLQDLVVKAFQRRLPVPAEQAA